MKKTLTIVALILAITVSLIAGTMSYYYTELEELAGGSVIAKEFILMGEKTQSKFFDVKIAPGEKVDLEFSVKNFDENATSETDMSISFKLELGANGNLKEITPLKIIEVKTDVWKPETLTADTNGVYTDSSIFKANKSEIKTYIVTVEWPWETEGVKDIEFAGASDGSNLTVSVTGTQVQP